MKVCHLTSGHSPFDGRIFHKESVSLAQAGFDVTVIAPAEFDERFVDGVTIRGVAPAKKRWQRAQVVQQIIQIVKALQPDIVHFHEPDFLPFVQQLRPSRVIYDCHEHYAHAISNKPYLPKLVRQPLSWVYKVVEPTLSLQVDGIVLVEDSQVKAFKHTNKEMALIYNYPRVNGRIPKHHSNGQTIIHTGANAENKGCRLMIKAMRNVVQQLPKAYLQLLGPFHNKAYELEIKNLVQQYQLQDNIEFVGVVPHAEVFQWLEKADIGLVPILPQYQQSIPTKMFEYMMAGLPIIASDLPINQHYIESATCGYVVAPNDPEAWAEKIFGLLAHPQEAEAFGMAGYQAVHEQFNWEAQAQKLITFYQSIVKPEQRRILA